MKYIGSKLGSRIAGDKTLISSELEKTIRSVDFEEMSSVIKSSTEEIAEVLSENVSLSVSPEMQAVATDIFKAHFAQKLDTAIETLQNSQEQLAEAGIYGKDFNEMAIAVLEKTTIEATQAIETAIKDDKFEDFVKEVAKIEASKEVAKNVGGRIAKVALKVLGTDKIAKIETKTVRKTTEILLSNTQEALEKRAKETMDKSMKNRDADGNFNGDDIFELSANVVALKPFHEKDTASTDVISGLCFDKDKGNTEGKFCSSDMIQDVEHMCEAIEDVLEPATRRIEQGISKAGEEIANAIPTQGVARKIDEFTTKVKDVAKVVEEKTGVNTSNVKDTLRALSKTTKMQEVETSKAASSPSTPSQGERQDSLML